MTYDQQKRLAQALTDHFGCLVLVCRTKGRYIFRVNSDHVFSVRVDGYDFVATHNDRRYIIAPDFYDVIQWCRSIKNLGWYQKPDHYN